MAHTIVELPVDLVFVDIIGADIFTIDAVNIILSSVTVVIVAVVMILLLHYHYQHCSFREHCC